MARRKITAPRGMDKQPIASWEWIHREKLRANDYNPNKVFPPEMRLLKISILQSGWTQPIVVRGDNEIVDGFHRWTVSADPDVASLTDSHVPIVRLSKNLSEGEQMMATVRHNRARGTHSVLPMADIVRALIDKHGMTAEKVADFLQMEDEEVDRLYDRGEMTKRAAKSKFNKGWKPA